MAGGFAALRSSYLTFFGVERRRRWEEVGSSEREEKRGSVKSTRSRLDSHLMAGSQCPRYLLHDSLPYLHQSPAQGGKQRGGLKSQQKLSVYVCVCVCVCVGVQIREKGRKKKRRE